MTIRRGQVYLYDKDSIVVNIKILQLYKSKVQVESHFLKRIPYGFKQNQIHGIAMSTLESSYTKLLLDTYNLRNTNNPSVRTQDDTNTWHCL